jgi:hypothetical protein
MTITRPWSTSRPVADGTSTASAAQKFTAGGGVCVAGLKSRYDPYLLLLEMPSVQDTLHDRDRIGFVAVAAAGGGEEAITAIRTARMIRRILRLRGSASIPRLRHDGEPSEAPSTSSR